MPYITREMVEYMHRNGMTANSGGGGGSGKGPRHSSKSTSASPDSSASRKRIRERPVNTELGNNNTSGSFALAAAATAHSGGGGGSRSSSHKQQQQKHQNSPRQQATAAPAAAPSLTTTPPPVAPELIGSRPATLAPAHDAVTHVSSKPAGVGGGGGGGPPRAPSKTTKVGMDKSSILVLPPNSQQPGHQQQQQQKPTSSHYSSHKSASSSGNHSFSSQNWSSGSGSSSSQSSSKTSPSSGGRSHKSGGQVSGLRRVASSGQATVQATNSSSHKSASGKKSKGGSHRVINVYHNAAANRGSGSNKSASSSSSSSGHSKHSPEQNSSNSKLDFDKAKVKFIHGLIRSNVQQFARTAPAEGGEKEFKQYVFDESKPFSGGGGGGRGGGPLKPHSCQSMHEATIRGEKESASNRLLVKIYSTAAQFPPPESFFKMLRHFGRKHPFIVATYDVFAFPSNKYNKQKSTYYVFQELATHRNALAFTKEHGPLAEGAVAAIGRQLRQAMDFIGDMGVCHRAIAPWHLLVFNVGSETTGGGKDSSSCFTIKVTGFRAAIIYYDDKRDDIHYQPCTPLPKRTSNNNSNSNSSSGKLPEFQAPETYGDPVTEEFDPVAGRKVVFLPEHSNTVFSFLADVWSFGATLYYLLCCRYPYHFGHHRGAEEQLQQKATATFTSLEDEIQQSIGRLKKQGTVGAAGHSLLRQTLTTVSVARTTVDRLKDHPFIVQAVPRPISAGGAAAAVQHPQPPPPTPPNHPNNNTH